MKHPEEDLKKTRRFALDLDKFLQLQFKRKRTSVFANFATVAAHTVPYDLYFRAPAPAASDWPHKTLVIARISFRDRRVGHGTRLLQFVLDWADENDVAHIGIECTNPDSYAFGTRFGMRPMASERDIVAPAEVVQEALRRLTSESPFER